MKQSINLGQFVDAFKLSESRKEQFSYSALVALYEYFEELENSTGEEVDFDMVGICCEWTEYDSLKDFQADYGEEYQSLDDIRDKTTVIELDGDGFLIQQF